MKLDLPAERHDDDMLALRSMKRDSMFVKASLFLRRTEHVFDIVVRNISAGGLLADSPQALDNGEAVVVNLRKVGDVPGRVVWSEGHRFGVAFDVAIDPQLVRAPVTVRKTRPAATIAALRPQRRPTL